MTKELEAFSRIEREVDGCMNIYHIEENDINIVKQALLELKKIKESDSNEALEKLDGMYRLCTPQHHYGLLDNYYNTIKNYILKVQEQEKVLKIIKEKNVDIWLLKSCLTVEQYNYSITKIDSCDVFNLTQEEFNKLKEWSK